MSSDKVGRTLAKAVGIDVDYRERNEPKQFVDSAAASVHSIDKYYEQEPTVAEFFQENMPTWTGFGNYIKSLFPFYTWIFHYNMTWAFGDFIAGITVGFVVIPQGMAYAELAELPVEYGLYTSFVGFILYWAFATSKDITIGTVAVMSTLVGTIVTRIQEEHGDLYSPPEIARALSVLSGAVLLFLGLTRLGWIVEFIPLVGISSFMTGAAISIAAGQVPKLLGISSKLVNTRESTYIVIINTLRHLPDAGLDAALGMTALFALYVIRWFCNTMAERQPQRKKLWFFLGTLRMAFIILLYTLASWLVNMDIKKSTTKTFEDAPFGILGTVPSGFQVHSAPHMPIGLLQALVPDLPATIIVLVIEHISISKSFGRVNNYTINPSQELVAVGFTNVIGPFLGAYPATGSFSRTAIKSKAGVRTPLAGVWTAILVLLAIYALTSVFYYIPDASLAGLIIHAVGDLITPPRVVYEFWQVSPIEVVVFFAGVIIMVFTDIETGIYFVVCASLAIQLVRMAKARGQFLGRVRIYRVNQDHKGSDDIEMHTRQRDAYIPMNRKDLSNPAINIQTPYPGVIVFRFNESPTYFNAGRYMDILTAFVQEETRPTTIAKNTKLGDRPWNNPGPRRGEPLNEDDSRPILRAIILDCAAINKVDVTVMQSLIDTRNQLDLHASPETVEWHVANLTNRWARRAFAASGFGFPSAKSVEQLGHWKPIYSVAATSDASEPLVGSGAAAAAVSKRTGNTTDIETGDVDRISSSSESAGNDGVASANGMPGRVAALNGVNRPYFHIDVAAAVESAVAHIQGKTRRVTIEPDTKADVEA